MTTPASAEATSLYYCIQATAGELPDNPEFKRVRFTGGVPSVQRDGSESAELTGTPEMTGYRLGSYNVTAENNVELYYGAHDDLIERAMQSTWQAGQTISSQAVVIDAANRTVTLTGFTTADTFAAGDLIKMRDLSEADNMNPKLVTAVAVGADTVLTLGSAQINNDVTRVDGIADEDATTDIVISDKVSIGSTRNKVALLTVYGDIEGGPKYELVMDAEVTGFSFNIAVNALVTGSMSLIGRTYAPDVALPAGATLVDPVQNEPFSGIDGSFAKDGARLMLSTSADIQLDRGASAQFEIGSKYNSHISYAKAKSTISVATMFENFDLQNQFEDETNGAYNFVVSLAGKAMSFSYPNCKISALDKDVSTGDITQTMSLQPIAAGGLPSLTIHRVE